MIESKTQQFPKNYPLKEAASPPFLPEQDFKIWNPKTEGHADLFGLVSALFPPHSSLPFHLPLDTRYSYKLYAQTNPETAFHTKRCNAVSTLSLPKINELRIGKEKESWSFSFCCRTHLSYITGSDPSRQRSIFSSHSENLNVLAAAYFKV